MRIRPQSAAHTVQNPPQPVKRYELSNRSRALGALLQTSYTYGMCRETVLAILPKLKRDHLHLRVVGTAAIFKRDWTTMNGERKEGLRALGIALAPSPGVCSSSK